MTVGIRRQFNAPGPVAAAYMACDKQVQLIMGPQGSGKTTCSLLKFITFAQQQRPSAAETFDGAPLRKFKLCVVRDTYRQLHKTTIPSWQSVISKETGKWNGGDGEPCSHEITFRLGDGSYLWFWSDFIAIGENKAEDVLRGYQPTAFYLNEADLMNEAVFTYCRGRHGRFPSMTEGGPSWDGILMDMNAPDDGNWTYKMFVENLPPEFGFFRQPSGFSPQAENLQNLPGGRAYYERMMVGQPDWWVRRMIKSEFGYSREGRPVYLDEFVDHVHVAGADLAPVEGLPLRIAADAGGHPAALISQKMPNGQRRVLDELVCEAGTGPRRFADYLNGLLKDRYEWWSRDKQRIRGVVDPSAAYGGDKESDEDLSWLQIVQKETGIRFRPAPTNQLMPRLEAVRWHLVKVIDGDQRMLLISPRCRQLRKGFNSGYRYKKFAIVGEDKYHAEPDKNDFSHPHDCLQYDCLDDGGYHETMGRQRQQDTGRIQTHAITEDRPQGAWAEVGGRDDYYAVE